MKTEESKKYFVSSARSTFAVFKREFFTCLATPSAWVFLVIFLVLASVCTFVISDALSCGQADLQSFFNWLPWLFMFVMPSLAMPFWAEEKRTGVFELLLSFPVKMGNLVIGKFLAGTAFLFIALLLTSGIPATFFVLGSPDAASIACGYAGAFLAGCVFLAVSCFCSAVTRSQTASFLLSLFLCACLMFAGWDRVIAMLGSHLPQKICRIISYCALIPHYQSFQRGLFDTSEILYCVMMTGSFLFLTGAVLKYSSSAATGIKAFAKFAFKFLAAFYFFFCIVCIGEAHKVKFDMTSDKAWSLTEEAKKIASSLDRPATITLYVSPDSSGMPGDLKQYASRVQWLFEEFVKASDGKLTLEVVRPEPDSMDEEAAAVDGVTPVKNQMGDSYYLGFSVSRGAKTASNAFLSPSSERMLEYEVVRAIISVARAKQPKIGVVSSLPVLGRKQSQEKDKFPVPVWYIFSELGKDYEIFEISSDATQIPDDVSAVMVIHPVNLPKRTLYALDQYLMRGGHLAVFVDPKSAYAAANAGRDHTYLNKLSSDLPELFNAWGINYSPDVLAADVNFKYDRISPSGVRLAIPTALMITKKGLAENSPETSSLDLLRMNFAGVFDFSGKDGRKYPKRRVLVHTTEQSDKVSVDDPNEKVFASFKAGTKKQELVLSAMLDGNFETAFPDGAPDSASEQKDGHRNSAEKGASVFIVADCDMLFHDACVGQAKDSTGQTVTVRINDNITFVQNVLEALCGSEQLSKLRSRTPMNRPLTKIDEARLKAELEFKDAMLKKAGEFMLLSRKAEEIKKLLIAGNGELTATQKEILGSYSQKESEFRRETSAIRSRMKEKIDSISSTARTVNIVVIPLAVALAGLLSPIARKISSSRARRRFGK